MKYIDDVLSKLSEREKNIIINLKSGPIVLSDYITNILIKHIDQNGFLLVGDKKLSLIEYTNSIIYRNSSAIEKFIIDNGVSVEDLNQDLKKTVYSDREAKLNDFDYTLTCRNSIYKNENIENVFVGNIVGTLCESNNMELLQMLDSLYSDNDEYSRRNNRFLNDSIDFNIDNIKYLEPIQVVMIGDKYYIKSDGHHRVYYLLLSYLVEARKAQNSQEIEQLKNKYSLPFSVTKKANNDILNLFSYAMLKCDLQDFKVLNMDDSSGKMTIQLKDEVLEVSNGTEFLKVIDQYIKNSENQQLLNILNSMGLSELENFSLEDNSFKHKI